MRHNAVPSAWHNTHSMRGTHLFLVVVVIGAGEQVAEDELWHVHALLLVHLHRHATAVVPHLDGVAGLRATTHSDEGTAQHSTVCPSKQRKRQVVTGGRQRY